MSSTNKQHPFEVGDLVCHANQEWAVAQKIPTAVIHQVIPQGDGTFEYVVTTAADFSRRPGPDNKMTRRSQWNSGMTLLVDGM